MGRPTTKEKCAKAAMLAEKYASLRMVHKHTEMVRVHNALAHNHNRLYPDQIEMLTYLI